MLRKFKLYAAVVYKLCHLVILEYKIGDFVTSKFVFLNDQPLVLKKVRYHQSQTTVNSNKMYVFVFLFKFV